MTSAEVLQLISLWADGVRPGPALDLIEEGRHLAHLAANWELGGYIGKTEAKQICYTAMLIAGRGVEMI